MLSPEFQSAWAYDFGLVYSVTLTKEGLETSLQVQNKGSQNFDFQVLMHTYFAVEVSHVLVYAGCGFGRRKIARKNETNRVDHQQDISQVRVQGLESKTYVDKTQNASVQTESSPAIAITQETDRVYQSLDPQVPIVVSSTADNKPLYSITREGLSDVVVWNPWIEKAKGIADFGPDDAYKNMICVEAGSVAGWQTLEAGDSWVGGQTIRPRL